MLSQKGQAVLTLGELVDNFCLEQGNMREAFITKYLVHAKWAWKDIFRTVIASTKTQAFAQYKNSTIVLPADCEKLFNISVVDYCGNMHPLTFNPNANTTEVRCEKGCSCQKCNGQGTLCGAIDSLTATETYMQFYPPPPTPPGPGVSLPVVTWVITNGCGDIQTVTKYPIPTWNGAVYEDTKQWKTVTQTLCNVEVNDHGCIVPTPANMELLTTYLAPYGFVVAQWNGFLYNGVDYHHKELLEPVFNYYGYWNFNAADSQIVHIFRNSVCPICNTRTCCDLNHTRQNIGSIIVSYQTSGEVPGKEIIVPEYAYDAVTLGIMYRMKALSMKPSNIGEAKALYTDAKSKAMMFLNPVRLDDIYKLQSTKILW